MNVEGENPYMEILSMTQEKIMNFKIFGDFMICLIYFDVTQHFSHLYHEKAR